MLDLPGRSPIDKLRVVGGCVRLPMAIDDERLRREVDAIPPGVWGSRGGRVGVHRVAEAVFLRGHAPAEGDLPVEDRPPLDALPAVREIIERLVPAAPLRCLLARLPPGAVIAPHIDLAPYFAKTLRLHVPVVSHARAWMTANGRTYVMRPGEAWILNNSARHGVWNDSESVFRTHLICDFLPSAALLDLVARGERDLGEVRPDVDLHLERAAAPGVQRAG